MFAVDPPVLLAYRRPLTDHGLSTYE